MLDAMVLENIDLSEDKIQGNDDRNPTLIHQTTVAVALFHAVRKSIFQPHVNFICTLDLKVLNYDLPFILCYELNSVHINLLISKGDG
jgi:hypothetical protein